MSCEPTRERLSALLDEALTASERAECVAHLEECADCRRELDRLRQTVAQVRALPSPLAPAGFAERVIAAARAGAAAPKRPSRPREPWLRRVAVALFSPLRLKLPLEAAALVVVAVGAVYLFQHTPELQQAARLESPKSERADERPAAPDPESARKNLEAARRPGGEPPPSAAPPAAAARPPSDGARHDAPAPRAASETPAKPDAAPAESAPRRQEAARERAGTFQEPRGGALQPAEKDKLAESKLADKKEEPAAPAEGQRGKAQGAPADPSRDVAAAPAAPPASRTAPAVGQTAAPAAPAPAPRSAELAAKRAAQPRLTGRLIVTDRLAADRALTDLLARVGGHEALRRAADGDLLIEIALPAGAYGAFLDGLGRIGRWRPDAEPAPGAEPVQLGLRVSETP